MKRLLSLILIPFSLNSFAQYPAPTDSSKPGYVQELEQQNRDLSGIIQRNNKLIEQATIHNDKSLITNAPQKEIKSKEEKNTYSIGFTRGVLITPINTFENESFSHNQIEVGLRVYRDLWIQGSYGNSNVEKIDRNFGQNFAYINSHTLSAKAFYNYPVKSDWGITGGPYLGLRKINITNAEARLYLDNAATDSERAIRRDELEELQDYQLTYGAAITKTFEKHWFLTGTFGNELWGTSVGYQF